MNLCEATQNELCLLLDQESPNPDLRDHLAKCPDCRTFAAKLRTQEKHFRSFAYPDSPDWKALALGNQKVPPATSASLARKERTLGKIAVAVALAASLLLEVVGLLTQFKNNSFHSQIAKSESSTGDPTGPASFRDAAPANNTPMADAKPFSLQGEGALSPIPAQESPKVGSERADGKPSEGGPKPKLATPTIEFEGPGQKSKVAPPRFLAKGSDDSMNRALPGGGGGPSKDLVDPGLPKIPVPAAAKMTAMGGAAQKPVLVPERVKTLRNLLDQQRVQAISLAKGERVRSAPGGGAKPDGAGNKPKPEAIVADYEKLVGSNLPNLLASLSNLPPGQLSIELKPLLEHLQSSESEYSRLAAQYPTDGEWLRQIALLARVGILQIRTLQKEI